MGQEAASGPRAGAKEGAELFRMLVELDAHFRAIGSRLPEDAPPANVWAGILFRVRDRYCLAPLAQIAEVLEPPTEVTPVPGIKPWMLGIANNRGTLLPIIDLGALVYGGPTGRRDSDRVLAVRQGAVPCGLLVDEVIGIRHFETASRTNARPAGLGVLEPFVDSSFPLDGESVPALALERLLADPLLSAGGA